jgi:phenylacetate-CoA ligase
MKNAFSPRRLFSSVIGVPLLDTFHSIGPFGSLRRAALQEGFETRTRMQRCDLSAKEDWVLRRLRSIVRRAIAVSTYYSETVRNCGFDANVDFTFDDFAKFPVLDRSDVQNGAESLVATDVDRSTLRPDATGGSTGKPVKIWVGPCEDGWATSGREFFARQIGISAGSRVALLWGHHLDPVRDRSVRQQLAAFLRNQRWFDCFRLSPKVLDEYHQKLGTYRPDCILAYASAIAGLAEHLLERNIVPSYPNECIITGAEKLFDDQRKIVERVFRCRVHERYGSRDIGLIGFQEHPGNSKDFTVDWTNLLVEPETNERESSILVTKLHADGMPMIRYRTSDIGLFPEGSRAGHPTYILLGVMGRELDRIWLLNGSYVHGTQFPHLMKGFPVQEFKVVQSQDYSVKVEIVPNLAFNLENRNAIETVIRKNLPGLQIRIEEVDEISRSRAGKWRPVETLVVANSRDF